MDFVHWKFGIDLASFAIKRKPQRGEEKREPRVFSWEGLETVSFLEKKTSWRNRDNNNKGCQDNGLLYFWLVYSFTAS